MLALGFGMVAALCWAVHDLCVRFVTQDGAIFPALMAVVFTGTVAVLPFAFWIGDWNAMGPQAYGLSILSGVCFTVASVALYNAFWHRASAAGCANHWILSNSISGLGCV